MTGSDNPSPRFAHDASTSPKKNKMLIFGGLVPDAGVKLKNTCRNGPTAAINGTFSNETWELGLENNQIRHWSRIPTHNTPLGRAGHTLTSTTNGVLLFGGVTSIGNNSEVAGGNWRPDINAQLTVLNDTWLYKDNNWVFLSGEGGASPCGRRSHSAVAMNLSGRESVVVFGGSSYLYLPVVDTSTFFNDLWAFDVTNSTWRALNPRGKLPAPRHSHAAVVTNNDTLIIYAG